MLLPNHLSLAVCGNIALTQFDIKLFDLHHLRDLAIHDI